MQVDDKLLRINVGAFKKLLGEGSLSFIRWCKGEDVLANCMMKWGASGFNILEVLQSGWEKGIKRNIVFLVVRLYLIY